MNMLEWVGVIVCYKFAETVTNMLKVPSFYKNGLRTDFLPSDMILLDKFVFVFTNLFMNDFLILPFLFTISSWSTVQFIHESISQITPISNYQKLFILFPPQKKVILCNFEIKVITRYINHKNHTSLTYCTVESLQQHNIDKDTLPGM